VMDPASFPLRDVERRLAKNRLKVYCGTGLGHDTDIGSALEPVRGRGIRHLSDCLRICTDLGSDSLGGVLHSPWGMQSRVDASYRERVSESLARIADEASRSSIRLALECLNRYENSFLNTVGQGLCLLRRIGRDNVGLHLDTYHMNIEERGIARGIAEAGASIFRMHLSENDRGYPGSGSLPWKEIITATMDAGYGGPWIIESYVRPDFVAASDVRIWRSIEPDMSESLRRSLEFLSSLLAG
jgi:D-psicose/D-tagatose/L-ribulose 3-epimerase